LTVLVDANVLPDVVTIDEYWSQWSVEQLDRPSIDDTLAINDIVYAEISVGYDEIEQVDELIAGMKLKLLPISRPALFLAAKVHERYRKAGGARPGVVPDFSLEPRRWWRALRSSPVMHAVIASISNSLS